MSSFSTNQNRESHLEYVESQVTRLFTELCELKMEWQTLTDAIERTHLDDEMSLDHLRSERRVIVRKIAKTRRDLAIWDSQARAILGY